MATDVQNANGASLTSLLTGIVSDLQDLIKQQLALFRTEVTSDVHKTKEALAPLAAGMGVLVVGLVMLSLMLVHLLDWATENLPLWACYGIVGAGFAVLGGALMFAGKKKFDSFNPLPDESAKELKETVQCLMNPK